jgi:hypothetical protein
MMKAVRTSETSVNSNETARRYIPEYTKLREKKFHRKPKGKRALVYLINP